MTNIPGFATGPTFVDEAEGAEGAGAAWGAELHPANATAAMAVEASNNW